jgi:opacity protein-like surface antigen
MKIKLLVAAAATVVASSAMAQSAFEGFYGQIATGYESNNVSSLNTTSRNTGETTSNTWTTGNQSFGGAPLVIGLGYNFSIAPKWLIGVGADYSALSQKSATYSSTLAGGGTISNQSMESSNRFNIFVAPGYEIDKDKLVYLKAGYSSVTAKNNSPTYYTDLNDSTQSGPITGLSNQSSTVGGFIVGLGYKQIITGGLYGFAEANYMSYAKPSFSGTTSDGTAISTNPSINSYQALIGVGYRF